MKTSTTHRLVFIFVFGPALLLYPLAFAITACRLSWVLGRDAAVEHLAKTLAEKKR